MRMEIRKPTMGQALVAYLLASMFWKICIMALVMDTCVIINGR